MATNPVYETMTRWASHSKAYVRVWREEPERKKGPDQEVLAALNGVASQLVDADTAPKVIVNVIGKLERVAAVEVLDFDGNGEIFYPDWK